MNAESKSKAGGDKKEQLTKDDLLKYMVLFLLLLLVFLVMNNGWSTGTLRTEIKQQVSDLKSDVSAVRKSFGVERTQ